MIESASSNQEKSNGKSFTSVGILYFGTDEVP